jgi:parvulin-like peptidyl-prolyl isomerase
MSAEPKVTRRKRRAPRGVPTIVEQREQRPFIFGYGAGLTRREREQLKERIALIAGIFIAVVVAAIIGWGVLEDNVIKPSQLAAANNKPIASIGNYVISTGFFKNLENFTNNNLLQNESTVNQQIASLGTSAKSAAQLAQAKQQLQQIQGQLANLPTGTLDEIINDQVAIQRGYTIGAPATKKAHDTAVTQYQHQVGGPIHYQTFIKQSGLTQDQLEMILVGEYLQSKIQQKVQANVKHTQTEVRASHILLAGTTKGHSEALKLMLEVQHGASFGALAKKFSTDTGSKVKGGDLGFFAHGQMVGPFDKEAFKLTTGHMGIVKSQFGWHLILVTARKAKTLTSSQYQSALQSAYQTWLSAQKAVLRVQRFVPTSKLPNVATTPTAVPAVNPQPQITLPAPRTLPTTHVQPRPVTGATTTGKKP